MTKAVPPVNAAGVQRRAGRRTTDPHVVPDRDEDAPNELPQGGTNLPVVAGPLRHRVDVGLGPVDAQILGQDGVKRGLKGGQPVLDQARTAYLETKYSGPADRRPRRGLITKTEL
jgi:hypothetical protein